MAHIPVAGAWALASTVQVIRVIARSLPNRLLTHTVATDSLFASWLSFGHLFDLVVHETDAPSKSRTTMGGVVTWDCAPPPTFSSTRLNKPMNETFEALLQEKQLRSLVENYSSATPTNCNMFVLLLNCASSLIHDKWAPDKKLVVFRDGHVHKQTGLLHEFHAGELDLGMVIDVTNGLTDVDLVNSLPWYLALSTVEWKGEIEPGIEIEAILETGAYLELAKQCRPDLVCMYGLLASPGGYSILYRSPFGPHTSREFDWGDVDALLAYIYTLYVPRPDLPSCDHTISRAITTNIYEPPTWNVCDGDEVYENCVTKDARDMTWVARVGTSPVTIKDTYRDVMACFREGEIYDILHKNGPAPGFLKVKKEYDVQCGGRPITVTCGNVMWVKKRLIMHTYGQPLRKCASLVEFLKCMYDILEAHRWAVQERNILHRDISIGNILVQAEDVEDGQEFTDLEYRPIFVNEVLNDDFRAPPMARLADMDNAAELDPEKAVSPTFVAKKRRVKVEPLRCRTGTPKYIARSPAIGLVLAMNGNWAVMPELSSDLAKKYRKAYSNNRCGMRVFADELSFHGGFHDLKLRMAHKDNRALRATEFRHRPRHDAESVFWCMVVFLLLAVPLGSPDQDAGEPALYDAWKLIGDHEIGSSTDCIDLRSRLLQSERWEEWLHEDLAHAGQLMCLLAVQVSPEWSMFVPPPHMFNLHEAMQRIILTHIHMWDGGEKDVKFDTERLRDPTDPYYWNYWELKRKENNVSPKSDLSGNTQSTSAAKLPGKRLADAIEEKEEPEAKRQNCTTEGTQADPYQLAFSPTCI
ncbi:hypothetical protein PLEOSDRAFT_1086452 [Pleurotus ostreatus PC15]|uniref:Fungal-type protein kinase domain-containing protein n=1 Tax=Pleurotus ostreatus (strain PC15) TaxID=1137138 RepID=A0A067NKQ2_PLEO1|nr:hypothetical protein PLEOSDRAFT_1086452 [Pleurotus ostreatus PC15]